MTKWIIGIFSVTFLIIMGCERQQTGASAKPAQPASMQSNDKVEDLPAKQPEKQLEIDAKVQNFLGQERADIIFSPDKVESFRIENKKTKNPEANVTYIEGYRVTAQGPELTKDQVQKLLAVLKSEKSYDFQAKKRCLFTPGVALRFNKGKEQTYGLICFTCTEWGFFHNGKEINVYFDPSEAQLIDLVKALFPQDSVLQQLEAKNNNK